MPAGKFEVAVIKSDHTWHSVEIVSQGANAGGCYQDAELLAMWEIAGRGQPLPEGILGVRTIRCIEEYSEDNPYNIDWSPFGDKITQTCYCGSCHEPYRSHAKGLRVPGGEGMMIISKDKCPECGYRECERVAHDPETMNLGG